MRSFGLSKQTLCVRTAAIWHNAGMAGQIQDTNRSNANTEGRIRTEMTQEGGPCSDTAVNNADVLYKGSFEKQTRPFPRVPLTGKM